MRRLSFRPLVALIGTTFAAATASAQPSAPSARRPAIPRPPAFDAISPADIRRDIDILAGDAMRGRESGTVDEIRAAVWLADRLRAIGVEPAGEDGSFFQWWPLERARLSESSRVAIDGQALTLWRDVLITAPGALGFGFPRDTTLDLPIAWVGDASAEAPNDVKGKAVVVTIKRPADAPASGVSLASFRYAIMAMVTQPAQWLQRGAAAVVLVADSTATQAIPFLSGVLANGSYAIGGTTKSGAGSSGAPVLMVTPSFASALRDGRRLAVSTSTTRYTYPSVNVIGRVRGSDLKLREEHVVFSGHIDHDGIRPPVDGDSIMNGADDNASTDVALLAIARAWKRNPGKRSALFIMHGAEEKGLLGSTWHAAHPVVAKSSLVAVIDGDLLGRNAPDSAALMGTQPPHRSSLRLAEMAMRANEAFTHFAVDTIIDRPSQPEQGFFRSDHLPYVRAGIPGLFFSSWLEPDYHTPRDEPRLIDEKKLARMARWMYATGWLVSQSPERITMDPGFKLER